MLRHRARPSGSDQPKPPPRGNTRSPRRDWLSWARILRTDDARRSPGAAVRSSRPRSLHAPQHGLRVGTEMLGAHRLELGGHGVELRLCREERLEAPLLVADVVSMAEGTARQCGRRSSVRRGPDQPSGDVLAAGDEPWRVRSGCQVRKASVAEPDVAQRRTLRRFGAGHRRPSVQRACHARP